MRSDDGSVNGDDYFVIDSNVNNQLHGSFATSSGAGGLTTEAASRVLVFTAYSERALLQRGLESGATGYVLKEASHETLLKAIEKVAAGETFVDPALIPSLATGRDGQEILTQREREILQLLADGMSNADVAQQLFISQETVKSHVRHILAKLEAETRTQAVAIALREAMID